MKLLVIFICAIPNDSLAESKSANRDPKWETLSSLETAQPAPTLSVPEPGFPAEREPGGRCYRDTDCPACFRCQIKNPPMGSCEAVSPGRVYQCFDGACADDLRNCGTPGEGGPSRIKCGDRLCDHCQICERNSKDGKPECVNSGYFFCTSNGICIPPDPNGNPVEMSCACPKPCDPCTQECQADGSCRSTYRIRCPGNGRCAVAIQCCAQPGLPQNPETGCDLCTHEPITGFPCCERLDPPRKRCELDNSCRMASESCGPVLCGGVECPACQVCENDACVPAKDSVDRRCPIDSPPGYVCIPAHEYCPPANWQPLR